MLKSKPGKYKAGAEIRVGPQGDLRAEGPEEGKDWLQRSGCAAPHMQGEGGESKTLKNQTEIGREKTGMLSAGGLEASLGRLLSMSAGGKNKEGKA